MSDDNKPSKRNLKRAAAVTVIFYLVLLAVILVIFNIANFRSFRYERKPGNQATVNTAPNPGNSTSSAAGNATGNASRIGSSGGQRP